MFFGVIGTQWGFVVGEIIPESSIAIGCKWGISFKIKRPDFYVGTFFPKN